MEEDSSEGEMLGDRHLVNMIGWSTATPKDNQQDTHTQTVSHTNALAVARPHATKDRYEETSVTDGPDEIEITQDDGADETKPGEHRTLYGNILYLDGNPLNIEVGEVALARGRE